MDCTVFELRRYALKPGAREALIDVFERELLEPQRDVGMAVLGQFRDPDDPDAFVWLRGFAGMDARRDALAAFYGGPVWKEHGPAANATMVDSDDVYLLRCARPLALDDGRAGEPLSLARFDDRAAAPPPPADALAVWETEPAPNTFPPLPVHEGVDVAVWLLRGDPPAAGAAVTRLEPTPRSALR